MKKILLVAAAAAGLASIAPAFAADGTITFQGQVTASSCKINGGASPASIAVTLPTVSTTSLNADAKTAGNVPFSISLSECAAGQTVARTYFEAGPTIDMVSGDLRNTAATTPASNVQIRLLNAADLSRIDLSKASGTAQGSASTAITGNAATLNYIAQYITHGGAAGAGGVNSNVTFTLQYL